MSKLTTGQVAAQLGISPYTLKRWYAFYEKLQATDMDKLNELVANGMPTLPAYDVSGSRGDRLWDEEDIDKLVIFQKWIPATKNGIFAQYL